jgi:hypothetical protein
LYFSQTTTASFPQLADHHWITLCFHCLLKSGSQQLAIRDPDNRRHWPTIMQESWFSALQTCTAHITPLLFKASRLKTAHPLVIQRPRETGVVVQNAAEGGHTGTFITMQAATGVRILSASEPGFNKLTLAFPAALFRDGGH